MLWTTFKLFFYCATVHKLNNWHENKNIFEDGNSYDYYIFNLKK